MIVGLLALEELQEVERPLHLARAAYSRSSACRGSSQREALLAGEPAHEAADVSARS